MSRLFQIASSLGISGRTTLNQLSPPNPLCKILEIHVENAEEYLDSRRLDAKAAKPPSKIASMMKTKKPPKKAIDRTVKEIFEALEAVVWERSSPELANVLISQLQSLGGDPNWNPPPKQSLTKRLASSAKLALTESELLQIATKSKDLDMIAVLAFYAEQWNLDACLGAAIDGDDLEVAKLLSRYGADGNTIEDQFPLWKSVKEGRFAEVRLRLRAPKPPTRESLSTALLQAVEFGDSQLVLEIMAKGGDYSINDFEPLRNAVEILNLETMVALLAFGKKVPSSKLLDELLFQVFSGRSKIADTHLCRYLEVLLCAGSKGKATNKCLVQAAVQNFIELAKLLVYYGASVEYGSARALHHAVSNSSFELISILLGSNPPPSVEHISAAVSTAMQIEDSSTRLEVMKLLRSAGATGAEVDSALVVVTNLEPFDLPNFDLLQLLLDMGADVNCENGKGLHNATRKGHLPMLKSLLTGSRPGPSPNTLSRSYEMAYKHESATRLKIIPLLFGIGMPIGDQINSSLVTLVSSQPPDYKLIRILLQNGTSVSFNNCQCLIVVGLNLDVELFELMMDYLSDPAPELISSILSNIFRQHQKEVWNQKGLLIMKTILKKGIQAPTLDEMLVYAITTAHRLKDGARDDNEQIIEFVSLLLEHGADNNYRNGLGLQEAAKYGMLDIIGLIVDESCSKLTLNTAFPYLLASEVPIAEDFVLAMIPLFLADFKGIIAGFKHPELDPLIFMALKRYPESECLLRALLEAGVPVDECMASTENGFPCNGELITPFMWIVGRPKSLNQIAICKMFLKFGANPDFRTGDSGTTPLLLATKTKNHEIIRLLIDAGSEVSLPDTVDTTPLWHASRGNDIAAAMMLLEAGAIRNDGSLHQASSHLHLETIEILLDAGHKLDFPCIRCGGRTPLEEVCQNATSTKSWEPRREKLLESTIKMLVTRGADLKRCQSGKSLLLIALDGSNSVPSVKILLRAYMYRYINEKFNLYTENGFTYSPTMYVEKGVCRAPKKSFPALLKLLKGINAIDVYYNESTLLPQPPTMINAPAHIIAAEQKRQEVEAAAARAADFAKNKFIMDKKYQEDIARAKKELDDSAMERRKKADKEALDNAREIQTTVAMTAKAKEKFFEREMKHRLKMEELDKGKAHRSNALVIAQQKVLEDMEKQYVKREKLEKATEKWLAEEKQVIEDRQKQRAKQEKMDLKQQNRLEEQWEQQRAIVRDMERTKEQLVSLNAGGGSWRRHSSFSDDSQ